MEALSRLFGGKRTVQQVPPPSMVSTWSIVISSLLHAVHLATAVLCVYVLIRFLQLLHRYTNQQQGLPQRPSSRCVQTEMDHPEGVIEERMQGDYYGYPKDDFLGKTMAAAAAAGAGGGQDFETADDGLGSYSNSSSQTQREVKFVDVEQPKRYKDRDKRRQKEIPKPVSTSMTSNEDRSHDDNKRNSTSPRIIFRHRPHKPESPTVHYDTRMRHDEAVRYDERDGGMNNGDVLYDDVVLPSDSTDETRTRTRLRRTESESNERMCRSNKSGCRSRRTLDSFGEEDTNHIDSTIRSLKRNAGDETISGYCSSVKQQPPNIRKPISPPRRLSSSSQSPCWEEKYKQELSDETMGRSRSLTRKPLIDFDMIVDNGFCSPVDNGFSSPVDNGFCSPVSDEVGVGVGVEDKRECPPCYCGESSEAHVKATSPLKKLSKCLGRIKYSYQSANDRCRRRYLAGTQQEGAYQAFNTAVDRVDCSLQIVSREPSPVVILSHDQLKPCKKPSGMKHCNAGGGGCGEQIPKGVKGCFREFSDKSVSLREKRTESKTSSKGEREPNRAKRRFMCSDKTQKQGQLPNLDDYNWSVHARGVPKNKTKPGGDTSSCSVSLCSPRAIMDKIKRNLSPNSERLAGGKQPCEDFSGDTASYGDSPTDRGKAYAPNQTEYTICKDTKHRAQDNYQCRENLKNVRNNVCMRNRSPNANANHASSNEVSLEECGKELDRLILSTIREYGRVKVLSNRNCNSPHKTNLKSTLQTIGSIEHLLGRQYSNIFQKPNSQDITTNCSNPFARKTFKLPSGNNPNPEMFTPINKHPAKTFDLPGNIQMSPVDMKKLLNELNGLACHVYKQHDNKPNENQCSQFLSGESFTTTEGVRSPVTVSFYNEKQSPVSTPPLKTVKSKKHPKLWETCPIALDTEIVSLIQLVPKLTKYGGFEFNEMATTRHVTRPASCDVSLGPEAFCGDSSTNCNDSLHEGRPNSTLTRRTGAQGETNTGLTPTLKPSYRNERSPKKRHASQETNPLHSSPKKGRTSKSTDARFLNPAMHAKISESPSKNENNDLTFGSYAAKFRRNKTRMNITQNMKTSPCRVQKSPDVTSPRQNRKDVSFSPVSKQHKNKPQPMSCAKDIRNVKDNKTMGNKVVKKESNKSNDVTGFKGFTNRPDRWKQNPDKKCNETRLRNDSSSPNRSQFRVENKSNTSGRETNSHNIDFATAKAKIAKIKYLHSKKKRNLPSPKSKHIKKKKIVTPQAKPKKYVKKERKTRIIVFSSSVSQSITSDYSSTTIESEQIEISLSSQYSCQVKDTVSDSQSSNNAKPQEERPVFTGFNGVSKGRGRGKILKKRPPSFGNGGQIIHRKYLKHNPPLLKDNREEFNNDKMRSGFLPAAVRQKTANQGHTFTKNKGAASNIILRKGRGLNVNETCSGAVKTSTSTDLILDTLDEISESLSYDNRA